MVGLHSGSQLLVRVNWLVRTERHLGRGSEPTFTPAYPVCRSILNFSSQTMYFRVAREET